MGYSLAVDGQTEDVAEERRHLFDMSPMTMVRFWFEK
jgi:hypothetical protein